MPVTRDMADAASESPFARISSDPMLSVMTWAFLRSTSWAAAEEVSASMKSAVTFTVSVSRDMVSPTSAVIVRSPPR